MYPAYIEVAKFQKEEGAKRSFQWAYSTEKMHKKLYEKAFEAVNNDKDVTLGAVQVCEVCGYTLEGDAPDRCLLCNVAKDRFTAFK